MRNSERNNMMLLDIYNFFGFPPVECQPSTFYCILVCCGLILAFIYLLTRNKK